MNEAAAPMDRDSGFGFIPARSRLYRAPHNPPDILEKLCAFLIQLPPVITIISFASQAGLYRGASLRNLAASRFSIQEIVLLFLLLFAWNWSLRLGGMCGRNTSRLLFLRSQIIAVATGSFACTVILWAGRRVFGTLRIHSLFASSWVFGLRCGEIGLMMVCAIALAYSIAYQLSPSQLYLIVGTRRRAVSAFKKIRAQSNCRANVLGFLDPDDSHAAYLPGPYLGSLDGLESILVRNPVDMVCFALPLKSQYETVQEAIRICERIGVEYSVQPDIFETRLLRIGASHLRQVRGFVYHLVLEDYRVLLKRIVDLVFALSLLLVLWPLMLLIAIAIKATSKGPVFFVQERYGRNRRKFRIYKFRSMVNEAEQLMKAVEELNEAKGPIFKIKRDPRITKIGRLLRKTSLDELPQLFNVVKGDMSLVGPRPMSLRDVHLFSEASLMRRFSVMPGITGLWQVSGRSNTNFDTWIKLDLEYIDHWSLGLDLKILLRTVPAVLSGDGAA
ncbi:MAG TPA: sugar transferase [Terracidiphilus sp.]|nr:sugar transferase [Terracidiphilus sp.]